MDRELMRKQPATIVAQVFAPGDVTLGLVGVERPIDRHDQYRPKRTPADWPAYIWAPLLCSPPFLVVGLVWTLIHVL